MRGYMLKKKKNLKKDIFGVEKQCVSDYRHFVMP